AMRQERVVIPALLLTSRRSMLRPLRHLPIAIFALGVPFFALALADPATRIIQEQVSYPGRRIALFVDASGSMMEPFETSKLGQVDAPAFFTTVAAAEYFMKLRIQGRYRDLIALIEFGDEAYVLTPFTTDYENILLSISLINNWNEWARFDARGTVIINALNVAVGLFRSFDFLEASGNAMVVFSDGQDTQVRFEGRPLESILQEAYEHKIPVYMLRVAANKQLGDLVPDAIWKGAIEKTGGRFYPVANEAAIFEAVHEIDRLAVGRIDVTRYTVNTPQFRPFALIAFILWSVALGLRVTVPHFSRFP
ncbi:MAG: VWA domain-containing protein, partial [Acidobacteria bacterium]|nr:VWA domain-containing protein [Acidobacteriota bacterium]